MAWLAALLAALADRQDIVGWDWFRGLMLWWLMSGEVYANLTSSYFTELSLSSAVNKDPPLLEEY